VITKGFFRLECRRNESVGKPKCRKLEIRRYFKDNTRIKTEQERDMQNLKEIETLTLKLIRTLTFKGFEGETLETEISLH